MQNILKTSSCCYQLLDLCFLEVLKICLQFLKIIAALLGISGSSLPNFTNYTFACLSSFPDFFICCPFLVRTHLITVKLQMQLPFPYKLGSLESRILPFFRYKLVFINSSGWPTQITFSL